jgi:hypothetical protein
VIYFRPHYYIDRDRPGRAPSTTANGISALRSRQRSRSAAARPDTQAASHPSQQPRPVSHCRATQPPATHPQPRLHRQADSKTARRQNSIGQRPIRK